MTIKNTENHMPSNYDPMTEIALGLSMIFFTMMILFSLPMQDQHMRKGQGKSLSSTQPSTQGTIGEGLSSRKHKYILFDGKHFFSNDGLKLGKAEIDKILENNSVIQIGLQKDMRLREISYLERMFFGKKILLSIIEKDNYSKNGQIQ